MKKLIKDKTGWMHVYLIRPMVILLCLSLVFAPVSVNALPSKTDDGSGGGYEPTLEQKIDMAKAGLLEIQAGQLTNYFPDHDKYFFANGISEINNALAVGLSESYIDYRAGDNPQILGQADIKGTNIGFRIQETGEPYLYKGILPGGNPPLQTTGGASILSDYGFSTPYPIRSSPVIANLDSDPEGELIVADYNGDVYAWDYTGGTWTGLLQTSGLFAHTDAGSPIRGTPAIANIDKDLNGIMEVVVGNSSGKVYVWHTEDVNPADGLADLVFSPLQTKDSTGTANDSIDNSIVLDDINNDTNLEIIAVGTNGGINIFNRDGTSYRSVFGYPSIVNSSPTVGDINKDGFSEIVEAHTTAICAWKYNGDGFRNTNGLFFQRPTGQGNFDSSPTLADIDGDGILEVVAVTSLAYIYALDEDASYVDSWPDATQVWPKRLGVTNATSSVAIGNIANYTGAGFSMYNNDLEMVVGAHNGNIYALHHDGKPVAGWPVDRTNDAMTTSYDSSPALADIDNDGDIEVIIGCWNGNLYGYHHDDQSIPPDSADEVAGFPKTGMGAIELSSPSIGLLGSTTAFSASIADVTGTTHIWNLAAPSTKMPWPKFRHDLKNTGAYLREDRAAPTLDSAGPFSVRAGSPLNFTVQGHDFGTTPLNVTDISAFNLPSGATFNFNDLADSGSFSWTPATTGSYTITFIATDSYGLHSTKSNVGITVTANNPPDGNIDGYIFNEDTTKIVASPGVLANDNDPDGDPLTADRAGATGPNNGTVTAFGTDGSFTYVPDPNYNGSDRFTYRAFDGALYSAYTNVTLIVSPVPDAPVATDDTAATIEDQAVNIYVLANDYDVDREDIAIYDFTQPANGTVTRNGDVLNYAPALNFDGPTDTFTYRIQDTGALHLISSPGTVTVTISPLPDNPVAVNDSDSTNEDTFIDVAVMANDYDPDAGDTISLNNIVTGPSHGTAAINGSNIRYTPVANYNGADSFTYNIKDSTNRISNTATVSMTVVSVPDNPVAVNDNDATPQGVAKDIAVLNNDFDPDTGDTISINSVVTQPAHGTAAINGTNIRYAPEGSYVGPTDSFTYNIKDSTNRISNTATVTITISAEIAPVANDDTYSTNEDTALNIAQPGVLSNDTDDDPITAVLSTSVSHGNLTLNPNGSFTYTPAANYFGPDSFTYRAYDGILYSNTAIVNITVNQRCDDAPTALNDIYSANEDTALNITAPGVLGNDINNESGTTLSAILVSSVPVGQGTLVWSPLNDGSFTYTPPANWYGSTSFTYKARSSGGVCGVTNLDSAAATVTINVNQRCDDAPTALNDSYSTNEDTVLTQAAPGVLSNDTNNEPGTTFSAVLVTSVPPIQGSLTLNSNGSFTYTPATTFAGTATFTYKARSSGGVCGAPLDSATTTVTITVNQICDDAPTALNDSYSTNEDTVLTQAAPGVLSNDTNNEPGTTFSAVLVTSVPVGQGSLTLNANGSFTYTPPANWYGATSFTYKARSSGGVCGVTNLDSAAATVTINVNQRCDDAPTALNDSYSTTENTVLNIAAPGVLSNDTNNEPGTTLSAVLVTSVPPSQGNLTLNANGSFTYTPATNFSGATSFTYKARSSGGVCGVTNLDSAAATVTITVGSQCIPPTTVNDTYSIDEDTVLSEADPGVLSNDIANEPGTALSAILVTTVSQGTLVWSPLDDGSFTYTPPANWYGTTSFTYKARSSGGDCGAGMDGNIATVTITVNPRCDDAPQANPETYNVLEDSIPITVTAPGVLSNDTNNEPGTTLSAILVGSVPVGQGTLVWSPLNDGSFTYTPPANFFGSTSFTYKARSSGGVCGTPIDSNVATVTITVTQLCDDAPTAVNDTYAATENTTLTVNFAQGVVINDINPEAPTRGFGSVSLISGSGPSNGTLTLAADGGFTYTPTPGYSGVDTFRYQVSNTCSPVLWSNEATVTINVAQCPGRVRLYDASGNFVQCFNNIQDAINYPSINNGYEITAAPGVYNERLTFDINKVIAVTGTAGANSTIINGQSAGTVVNFRPATAGIAFSGFTVRYGLTSGNGGGIIIENAPVNIIDCNVIDNTANGVTSKGGGIYINSNKPVSITGTNMLRNSATYALSNAMYVSGTGVHTVSHSLIQHNTGGGGGGGGGGEKEKIPFKIPVD